MHLSEAHHELTDGKNIPKARYYTTGDFLDMITALREHDPGAASHTLVGLLRMACEGKATPVEQTALRIAGLGEMDGQKLRLTHTAQHLLGRYSSGDYDGNIKSGRFDAANDDTPKEKTAADIISEQSPELIARLRIGGVDYMIGEIPSMDMLVFHQMDDPTGEWKNLNNTVAEGWSQIAAEIIAQTRDTTREYIRMHTDNVPLSGGQFMDNWGLAAGRASSVVRELAASGLIDESRLTALSKGESDPVADNATAEGRELNRRIEIEIDFAAQ